MNVEIINLEEQEPTLEGGAFLTLNEIRRANRVAGGYWFTDGAEAFFESTYIDIVFGGRFFVYSTTFRPSQGDPVTRWHIAFVRATGHVEALPGSGWPTLNFDTDAAAIHFAQQLEAGRPGIGRLAYDAAIPCRFKGRDAMPCGNATWLQDSRDEYCAAHMGEVLQALANSLEATQ